MGSLVAGELTDTSHHGLASSGTGQVGDWTNRG